MKLKQDLGSLSHNVRNSTPQSAVVKTGMGNSEEIIVPLVDTIPLMETVKKQKEKSTIVEEVTKSSNTCTTSNTKHMEEQQGKNQNTIKALGQEAAKSELGKN